MQKVKSKIKNMESLRDVNKGREASHFFKFYIFHFSFFIL